MKKKELLAIIGVVVVIIAGAVYGVIEWSRMTSSRQSAKIAVADRVQNTPRTEVAIAVLDALPEVQTIKNAVVKAGRKPFYTPEGEDGDIVSVSLRESFPEDEHTSRIDSFNVNVKTGEVTVEDIVSGGQISYDEWKKSMDTRFP